MEVKIESVVIGGKRIEVGSSVWLKSANIHSGMAQPVIMVVEKILDGQVHTVWLTNTGSLRRDSFDPAVLDTRQQ